MVQKNKIKMFVPYLYENNEEKDDVLVQVRDSSAQTQQDQRPQLHNFN